MAWALLDTWLVKYKRVQFLSLQKDQKDFYSLPLSIKPSRRVTKWDWLWTSTGQTVAHCTEWSYRFLLKCIHVWQILRHIYCSLSNTRFAKNYKSQDFRSCNKNLEDKERKPDFFFYSFNLGFLFHSKQNFNIISVFPFTLFPLTQASAYSLHYALQMYLRVRVSLLL